MENEKLKQELEYFKSIIPDLIQKGNEGRFVLIKNNDLAGIYTTEQTAFEEGLRRWGNTPFLIAKISKVESQSEQPVSSQETT